MRVTERCVLLTGCSGGGKSTLLEALAARGYVTVPEPGRRIVAEELASGGRALPWLDMAGFARGALAMAQADLEGARPLGRVVFFDRGIIDAAVALEHCGGPTLAETLGEARPYARRVFVAPPWEAIFQADAERRHDFAAATQEYDRIMRALERLGYAPQILPRVPVAERADLVLQSCAGL